MKNKFAIIGTILLIGGSFFSVFMAFQESADRGNLIEEFCTKNGFEKHTRYGPEIHCIKDGRAHKIACDFSSDWECYLLEETT